MFIILIFILFNFIISVISDLILNFLSGQSYSSKLIQSLKTYFSEQSALLSSVYAGLTVIITLIITILISKLLLKFYIPNNNKELIKFIILAFIIGFISDFIIYKFKIFGNSLNTYYSLTMPGFWGAMAFIFSITISYILMKILF